LNDFSLAFSIVCVLHFVLARPVPHVRKLMEERMASVELFLKETAQIEISHDSELERVFFRIPPICHNLTERSKNQLLWSVS
jgi:hypothetical protein